MGFAILSLVYDNFATRTPTTLVQLRRQFPASEQTDVDAAVRTLVDGRILACHEENGDDLLLPLTPADHLDNREIVHLVLGRESLPGKSGDLATRAVDAAAEAVADSPVFPSPRPQEHHEQGITPDHS
jgi:hypothetical protein